MTRRGNGEGSIYKRRDGRWEARLSLPGHQRKAFYAKTRGEAARQLALALKTRSDGMPAVDGRQTVARFLARWLDSTSQTVRPRTFARYEQYVRLHAVPEIGSVPLARLGPDHLQRLYSSRLAAGSSASTVAHLHAVLHRALHQATRWGLVPRNVAELVDPPRVARREMTTLSPEQVRVFLDMAAGSRLAALYALAVTTGMRQGELLALRWQNIDVDAAKLEVSATLLRTPTGFVFAEPKTAQSRRQITMSRLAVAALRAHCIRQGEDRLRAGDTWQDIGLVFTNSVGRPLDSSNLLNVSFRPLLRRAGLPRIRFHDLRHTAATLLLGQGVHPKVVAEMLGHSQIAVTLDLYSHVTPTMQRQAAAAFDALLG